MAGTTTLTQDQDRALRKLYADGVLTIEQADAVRAALGATNQGSPGATTRHWLPEILGYLGGGLMLGGAALLVATSWADLSRPARIVLLVAVSVALVAVGVLIGGGPRALRPPSEATHSVRLRVTGVLFALSAATSALAAGTIATTHEVFWAGATGLAVAAVGYLAVRAIAGLLTTAVLSTVTVGELVGNVLHADARGLAAGLVLLGLTWGMLTATGAITHAGPGSQPAPRSRSSVHSNPSAHRVAPGGRTR